MCCGHLRYWLGADHLVQQLSSWQVRCGDGNGGVHGVSSWLLLYLLWWYLAVLLCVMSCQHFFLCCGCHFYDDLLSVLLLLGVHSALALWLGLLG